MHRVYNDRRYLIPFRATLLPQIFTDTLVIGAGVAGMRAAYQQILTRFPLHQHTRDQLAQAMVRDGEIEQAVELLRDGVALKPQDRDSWLSLASFMSELGGKDAAVDVLDRALHGGADPKRDEPAGAVLCAYGGHPDRLVGSQEADAFD